MKNQQTKFFSYPEEMQLKMNDLNNHMQDWSTKQNDILVIMENYDDEFDDYSTKIGLFQKDIDLFIANTNVYALQPHPDYGDLFTIEKFSSMVKHGYLIDYDGHGYYATEDKVSDIPAKLSMFENDTYRKDFEYIMWYNR